MNDMIVKSVDVMGDFITAAKDHDGNVWVGVRWVCDALDMTEGQMKRQIKNIKKDMVFGEGGSNQIPLPTAQGTQEVFCIRNDFIPLWLAKISITQKTREERPEFSNKLLEYQLKAKDILAAAFVQQPQLPTEPMEMLKIHYAALEQVDQKVSDVDKKVDTLEQRFNKFEDELPVTGADIDHIQTAVRKKGIQSLGGKQSNAYKDISTRTFVYADIQCELRRQFGVKRYREIKHKDAPDAIRIIVNYELPIALKNRVDMVNAQESLGLEGGAYNG